MPTWQPWVRAGEICFYDPQLAAVALSAMRSTSYAVRYIVAGEAKARSNVLLFAFRVAD